MVPDIHTVAFGMATIQLSMDVVLPLGIHMKVVASGAPVPPGGGTIMSYCHLAGVGINFSLGFGSQPTAVILNKFNGSSCSSACTGGGFCSAATGMTTNNISNSSATFDWISVSGAVI